MHRTFSSTAWFPESWLFFSSSSRVQRDPLKTGHWPYPLKLCLICLAVDNLDKCRLAAMLVLRHSHLPVMILLILRRKGESHQMCCPGNSGPLGVPCHLQFVPDNFLSVLSLRYAKEHSPWGPFSSLWKRFQRCSFCRWFCWWNWNHFSVPSSVTFGGGSRNSGVSSTPKSYTLSGVSVWVLLSDLIPERHNDDLFKKPFPLSLIRFTNSKNSAISFRWSLW